MESASNSTASYSNHAPQLPDEIDLSTLLRTLRSKYKLILLSTLLGICLAICFVFIKTPLYQASALIQVNDQVASQSILSQLSPMMAGKIGQASPSQIQQALLKSRYILEPVIQDLGLDIHASPKYLLGLGPLFSKFYHGNTVAAPRLGLNQYAWGGESIRVSTFQTNKAMLDQNFTLIAGQQQHYSLYDANQQLVLRGQVGQLARSSVFPGTSILVQQLVTRPGVEFTISKDNMPAAVQSFIQNINVGEYGSSNSDTGVLQVTLKWPNASQLPLILNKLIAVWANKNVSQKSQEAAQALHFVQQQIPQIQQSLSESEKSLNDYRAQKGILDIGVEAKILLQEISDQEQNLQQLKLKKAELLRSFTSHHPVILSINDQIHKLQLSVTRLEKHIRSAPHEDQKAISLMRDVKAKEMVYTTMLGKIQELKLAEAGTTGDVQILDPSTDPLHPIPMHKSIILLAGALLGFFVSCIYIFIKQVAFDHAFCEPDKLEKMLGIPVCAIVPYSPKQHAIQQKMDHLDAPFVLAEQEPTSTTTEAFRSFRTNLVLKHLNQSANIIAFLGSSPNIGKSFSALNTSYLLSELEQSVLLIDCDIRKGTLHKSLCQSNENGLADYCMDPNQSPKIHSIFPNLSFLSCGTRSSHPAELFGSEHFKKLLEQLSKEYDIVVLDTPPVLAVTDALLIAQHTTSNFFVMALAKNNINEVKHAVHQFKQNDVDIHGIICNYTNKSAQEHAVSNYSYYNYSYE